MKTFNFKKLQIKWKSFLKDPLFLSVWDEDKIYRYHRGRQDNQLHKNIYAGYSHDPYYIKSDTHMLIEDLHMGITPFVSLRKRDGTDPIFTFTPPISDRSKERVIISGISERDRASDLTEACGEFIRHTTQQLMAYGEVYYELVYEAKDDTLISFSFESAPTKYLIKLFNNYYQIIPWWVARKARKRAGIIKIPANKMFHIRIPSELGGKSGLMRMLSRLYKISENMIPSFTMDSMKMNEETGFDTNRFSKNRYLETAQLTRRFGWNQRSRSNNHTTEWYYFKRYLDSEKAKVILRELILQKLNKFLNGSIINAGCQVTMHGFITREEITAWEGKMQNGNIKLIDMFNDLKDR